MAIDTNRDTTTNPELPKLNIGVNNGDLEALDDALKKWKFKDEASMLRFVIAILREAKDHVVYVTGEGGKQVAFAPADHLLDTAKDKPKDEPKPDEPNE